MKEDGWFLSDGDGARHEPLALSRARKSDCLLSLGFQPHVEFRDSFGLFWKTTSLLWLLPFSRWAGRTRPLKGLILILLLQSSLLLNIGPSPSGIHLCTKVDRCQRV